MHNDLQNSTCDSLKYTIGSPLLIVHICVGKSIRIQRVKIFMKLGTNNSQVLILMMIDLLFTTPLYNFYPIYLKKSIYKKVFMHRVSKTVDPDQLGSQLIWIYTIFETGYIKVCMKRLTS